MPAKFRSNSRIIVFEDENTSNWINRCHNRSITSKSFYFLFTSDRDISPFHHPTTVEIQMIVYLRMIADIPHRFFGSSQFYMHVLFQHVKQIQHKSSSTIFLPAIPSKIWKSRKHNVHMRGDFTCWLSFPTFPSCQACKNKTKKPFRNKGSKKCLQHYC